MCISATVMMAAQAVGSVLQMRGAVQSAEFEANQLATQAAQEKIAAEQEAAKIRKAGEKQAGAARAALAASGVDVNSGTAININEDIYGGAESDAQNTLLTGKRRAATLNAQGRQTLKSAANKNMGTLLNTATNMASGWKSAQPTADPVGDFYYRGNRGMGD